jgi:hypothetical protein
MPLFLSSLTFSLILVIVSITLSPSARQPSMRSMAAIASELLREHSREPPQVRAQPSPLRRAGTSAPAPWKSCGRTGRLSRSCACSGFGMAETGLIFTHEDWRALTPDGVSQRFDRMLAWREIPPIRQHDLRTSRRPWR